MVDLGSKLVDKVSITVASWVVAFYCNMLDNRQIVYQVELVEKNIILLFFICMFMPVIYYFDLAV